MTDGTFLIKPDNTKKAKIHMNCNCHRATNVATTMIIGYPTFCKKTLRKT